jgi:hypothetical protein
MKTICCECTASTPRGVAFTKDWIFVRYPMGAGIAELTFCSWECLHRYTVGAVIGEAYMMGSLS